MRGRRNLVYQHGELVAPKETLVTGASTVIVPTQEVADTFLSAGYKRDQIFVSGLCIESELARLAADSYQFRQARFHQRAGLTGLFFSSRAEPRQHIELLVSSIASCRRAGISALVLVRKNGRLAREFLSSAQSQGITYSIVEPVSAGSDSTDRCQLGQYEDQAGEDTIVARWFLRIDFIVGPPHERTNWAVGLGLPMFVLTPPIGPFAPMNLRLLESSGVGLAIRDAGSAAGLGPTILALNQTGKLAEMATRGWGKYQLDGFDRIARFLVQHNRH
ncbi:MAG: hypothetical protein AB1772_06800 [Candidatus Zixiibacteriota bacterium]